MKATMSRNVTPSFIKDNLQPTTSLIEIKDHTINRKFNLFLLLCFEGKKVSQPTVPCLSGRNIHANGIWTQAAFTGFGLQALSLVLKDTVTNQPLDVSLLINQTKSL